MMSSQVEKKLTKMKRERDKIRSLFGSKSAEYVHINNQINNLQRIRPNDSQRNRTAYANRCVKEGKPPPKVYKKQEQDDTTPNKIHLNFHKNKLEYKNLKIEPRECKKISCSVYAGNPLQSLPIIPTEADSKKGVPDYKPKSKLQEGGILEFTPYKPSELSIDMKDKIISVAGHGFGDPEFSFDDADVTHRLLYREKGTIAVVIEYMYNDPKTKKRMIDIV